MQMIGKNSLVSKTFDFFTEREVREFRWTPFENLLVSLLFILGCLQLFVLLTGGYW